MATVELSEVGLRLRAELTLHPGDAQLRLVYADWLEESGQLAEAQAQRKRVAYMDQSVWPADTWILGHRYEDYRCRVFCNSDGSWTCEFTAGGSATHPTARELFRQLLVDPRCPWVCQVRLHAFFTARHLLSDSKPLEEF